MSSVSTYSSYDRSLTRCVDVEVSNSLARYQYLLVQAHRI